MELPSQKGGDDLILPCIGANIRRLRSINDMKQDDLANRLKISRQMLHNYENGFYLIPEKIISKIEAIFGVDRTILLLQNIATLLKGNR